jgi:hypothetical protein
MYINDTGLPSVSDILRPYINSTWFTDESRTRGEIVHAYAASYLTGLFMPAVPEEYQGYCESVKKWIDNCVIEVVLVEQRLEDKRLGFCGKPDAIVKIKGDPGYSLPDFKTGQSLSKAWRLQSAGYRHLAKADKGIDTLRGFPVRPKKDGSGVLPVDDYAKDIRADMNIFQSALNTYRFFNSK